MRILIAILLTFNIASSLELKSEWNSSFKQVLVLSCNENEADICFDRCQDLKECSFEEGYCRNCAGTNLYLKEIFSEVGEKYVAAASLPLDDLYDRLDSGDYISITSKSIYNFVTSFDALELRMRFRRVCNYKDPYPILFFDAPGRFVGAPLFVVCNYPDDGLKLFELITRVETVVNP